MIFVLLGNARYHAFLLSKPNRNTVNMTGNEMLSAQKFLFTAIQIHRLTSSATAENLVPQKKTPKQKILFIIQYSSLNTFK